MPPATRDCPTYRAAAAFVDTVPFMQIANDAQRSHHTFSRGTISNHIAGQDGIKYIG